MPLFNQDLEAEKGLLKRPSPSRSSFWKTTACSLLPRVQQLDHAASEEHNRLGFAAGGGEGGLAAYKGKVATLMSASPGAAWRLARTRHRPIDPGQYRCRSAPEQIAVPTAHQAIGEDGRLKDEKMQASIEGLGGLAEFLKKTITS
jgi:hypothetical protein